MRGAARAAVRHPQLPLWALLAGATLWGLTWWPLSALRELGLGGVVLTLLGTGAAALVILPWAWPQRHCWSTHVRALWLILLFGGYSNLAYVIAMVNGNPVRVMMLFYLAPIWALLGAKLFLDEHIGASRALAVLIAVCGAFSILGGLAALRSPPAFIDVLAISAGFAYAMNNLAYRKAAELPLLSKNAAMFSGSALLALITLAFMDVAADAVHINGWWGGVFGLLWLIPAVVLTQYGVTHMEASRSAILLTLELPIAAVSAALLAGVRLTPAEMAGGALILAAAMLDAWRTR